MTNDISLHTWLREQIDWDESLAKEVPGSGRWNPYLEGGDDGWAIEDAERGDPGAIIGNAAMARHIAAQEPARVLREVDAKRRLLEQFVLRGNSVRATVKPATGGVWDDLLRMLAMPYADRPGYRNEWRPE